MHCKILLSVIDMRARDFILLENELTATQKAQTIFRDCQPYLYEAGDPVTERLFRGIHANVDFSLQPCPVNRKPLDTKLPAHKVADAWFFKQFGVNYRSNAFFATSNQWAAYEYGDAYTVYPTGNFKFCWSPLVSDMTYDLTEEVRIQDFTTSEEYVTALEELLIGAKYTNKDMSAAIASKHEVMIHCPHYYVVRDDDSEIADMLRVIMQ